MPSFLTSGLRLGLFRSREGRDEHLTLLCLIPDLPRPRAGVSFWGDGIPRYLERDTGILFEIPRDTGIAPRILDYTGRSFPSRVKRT